MRLQSGIQELDLHGMTCYQAKIVIDAALRRAGSSAYRLELIHGYRGGTELKTMIRRDYNRHPKVLRLEMGLNPGSTDLVLREF